MAGIDRTKSDFTLRQLHTFVQAARADSFGKAAAQLGVSQPAVSSCIAILESRLGRKLFNRRNGAVSRLTRDGTELLAMAETMLSTGEAIRTGERNGVPLKRRVRLCIGPMLRDLYLKPMLPLLYRDHPEIDIELVPVIPLDEIHAALDKGHVDLVVYTIGRPVEALPNVRLIGEVPVIMIGPLGTASRIASGETQIEDLPFILPSANRLSADWIERQLAALDIRPRRRIVYLDFPDVIQDMVAQGMGVSVLMREQVARGIGEERFERFGPDLPAMRRVIMRSRKGGEAARIVEDYLADVLRLQGTEPARAIVPESARVAG